MGVMAVGLFITIFLLFHRISSSKSKTQPELVEARGKICELCERPTKIGADLKAEIEKELNKTRKENAEVERQLRSESMELKAELQSERENKTAEIAKLQADLNRTMSFLDLDGWSYLEQTASWYKVIDQRMSFDQAEAYCGGRKSHLVSIHSQEENHFVQELANTLYSNAWFWIGLKRNPNKGNAFEWMDGILVDFTNWYLGEPDLRAHALLRSYNGKWAVYPPTFQAYFICKRSSRF